MGGHGLYRGRLHSGFFGLVVAGSACNSAAPRPAQPQPRPVPQAEEIPPVQPIPVADPVSPVADDLPNPTPNPSPVERDVPQKATRIDPRAIPPGTPAEHARAFRRLPVSVHDGPPVAGIGKSGIHIDRVWLGSEYGRRGCSGLQDNFPTDIEQVNVCFRVVHNRELEHVDVIWEQEATDMVKRRRGVQIPAQHAYRSRAYLALRHEYTGRWRVRIFSEDEVELASASFTVVPKEK